MSHLVTPREGVIAGGQSLGQRPFPLEHALGRAFTLLYFHCSHNSHDNGLIVLSILFMSECTLEHPEWVSRQPWYQVHLQTKPSFLSQNHSTAQWLIKSIVKESWLDCGCHGRETTQWLIAEETYTQKVDYKNMFFFWTKWSNYCQIWEMSSEADIFEPMALDQDIIRGKIENVIGKCQITIWTSRADKKRLNALATWDSCKVFFH